MASWKPCTGRIFLVQLTNGETLSLAGDPHSSLQVNRGLLTLFLSESSGAATNLHWPCSNVVSVKETLTF